jgi:hypothetical protein
MLRDLFPDGVEPGYGTLVSSFLGDFALNAVANMERFQSRRCDNCLDGHDRGRKEHLHRPVFGDEADHRREVRVMYVVRVRFSQCIQNSKWTGRTYATWLSKGTKSVDTYSFIYNGPPQRRVFLVDTPGFDDTVHSDAEVLRRLAVWLRETYANRILLSGIIYLHPINESRMRGSARHNIQMFKKLCGNAALKNVILATTKWDLVEEDVGVKRQSELVDKRGFWGCMVLHGSMTHRHDNTQQSAMRLIGHIVKADSKVALEIQEEMVDHHKTLDGTAAAATVESAPQQERPRFDAELHSPQTERQEALRMYGSDPAELIREARDEHAAGYPGSGPPIFYSPAGPLPFSYTQVESPSYDGVVEYQHQSYPPTYPNAEYNYYNPGIEPIKVTQEPLRRWRKKSPPRLEEAIESYEDQSAFRAEMATEMAAKMAAASKSRGFSMFFTKRQRASGSSKAAQAPDAWRIAAAGCDIKIWDTATNQCVLTVEPGVWGDKSVTWAPDGKRFASGGNGIQIWDVTTGQRMYHNDYQDSVKLIAWSPDATRLAMASLDKTWIWDLARSERVLTFDSFECRYDGATCLSWSSDGTKVACATNIKVEIRSPETEYCFSTLEGHTKKVNSVA